MKIAIVGAGAIGGFVAARLALAGHQVSVVARGAHLAAMQSNGLGLIESDGERKLAPVTAVSSVAELGQQDVLVVALKAHQLGAVAADIGRLLRDNMDTTVVTMQNGVPFWYFHKLGGKLDGVTLESVDPGGHIIANLSPDRLIGSIVYPACDLQSPGVVRHIEGNKFTLGELDGSSTDRVRAIAEAFKSGGLKAPVVSDIRSELWIKLWGNVCFNPISALTHATLQDICEYEPGKAMVRQVMAEAQAIGEALGIRFKVDVERRIAGAAAIGQHKTSMLQDVEAGRPIELEAIVGAVLEMAQRVDFPAPGIGMLYGLTALLRETLQRQHGKISVRSASE